MSQLNSEIAKSLALPHEPYSTDWNYSGTLIDALLERGWEVSFELNKGRIITTITEYTPLGLHNKTGIALTKEKSLCLAIRRKMRSL